MFAFASKLSVLLQNCFEDSFCSIIEISINNELMGVKLFVLVLCNPSFFQSSFFTSFFPAGWFDKQTLMQWLKERLRQNCSQIQGKNERVIVF